MSFAKRLKYECDAYLHNCECEEDVTEESKQEYINHLNGLSMQAIEECAASYLFENSFIHYSYSINPKVSTDELQEYYEFLHKQFLELTDVEKDSDNLHSEHSDNMPGKPRSQEEELIEY